MFQNRVLSGYIPRSGVIESCDSCVFSFLTSSILFSIVTVTIYIPTNSVGVFPFLHTSLAFITCRYFYDGILIM